MSARRRFLLSSEARDDLESIIQFSQENWGREQATRYRRLLRRGFANLARFPHLGLNAPEIGQTGRMHIIGTHIVYYRPIEEGILITRIIHQRRDPRLFES